MAEYRLYCFAQSGNAYTAALMLNLCGAAWEPRFVDFFGGETRTPEYRQINEMGEVPVLEHGGRRLAQSGVILDYLAERFGRFGWESEDERREIMRWLLWDNHKLTSYIGTLRFLLNFMQTGETPVTEFLRGRVLGALGILNGHLAGRQFALFERPTIADLSMCGYLYWPDEFGVSWADHPHIAAWLERIRGLPDFEELRPLALLVDVSPHLISRSMSSAGVSAVLIRCTCSPDRGNGISQNVDRRNGCRAWQLSHSATGTSRGALSWRRQAARFGCEPPSTSVPAGQCRRG